MPVWVLDGVHMHWYWVRNQHMRDVLQKAPLGGYRCPRHLQPLGAGKGKGKKGAGQPALPTSDGRYQPFTSGRNHGPSIGFAEIEPPPFTPEADDDLPMRVAADLSGVYRARAAHKGKAGKAGGRDGGGKPGKQLGKQPGAAPFAFPPPHPQEFEIPHSRLSCLAPLPSGPPPPLPPPSCPPPGPPPLLAHAAIN